jgi:hypothetical protein
MLLNLDNIIRFMLPKVKTEPIGAIPTKKAGHTIECFRPVTLPHLHT